jgi:hypothetical protein
MAEMHREHSDTLGRWGWLEGLFGVVSLTHVVASEVQRGSNKPGKAAVTPALAKGRLRIVEDIWTEPLFPTL